MKQVVRRFPQVGMRLQYLYRLSRPRFTVGAVGVLLDNDGRVFLVEHAFHSVYPWGLPGGWVDADELPHHAVEREFREETGLTVQVVHPIELWSSHYWRNHLDIGFRVKLVGDIPSTLLLSIELTGSQWAYLDALPPLLPDHRRLILKASAYQQEALP